MGWELLTQLLAESGSPYGTGSLRKSINHGSVGGLMAADGGDAEEMIAEFAKAGIDYDNLASDLQREGDESFVKDWNELFVSISSKSAAFKAAG